MKIIKPDVQFITNVSASVWFYASRPRRARTFRMHFCHSSNGLKHGPLFMNTHQLHSRSLFASLHLRLTRRRRAHGTSSREAATRRWIRTGA